MKRYQISAVNIPPKGITDETIVCLSKLADTHIEMEIDPEESRL